MTERDEFGQCWKKFEDRIRGRLLTASRNRTPAFREISGMLETERGFWSDPYQEGGRWLKEFGERNGPKAAMVREILADDMRFAEEASKGPNTALARILRTVAGAAAGGVLGWVWGRTRADFQMWIPAVSALVCAAAAYYLGMTFDEGAEEKGRRGLADAYLRQLDKFRLGVESVLADA